MPDETELPPTSRHRFRGGLATSLAWALVLVTATAGCRRSYRMPGEGMYPTIQKGQRFAVSLRYSKPGDVQRGDVVVYRFPEDPTRKFLHRITAVPGDRIQVAEGRVLLNGQPLPHEAARTADGYRVFRETNGRAQYEVAYSPSCDAPPVEQTLRPDHFFVMGDNRCKSRDSRFFGPVSFDAIEGRVDVSSQRGDAR